MCSIERRDLFLRRIFNFFMEEIWERIAYTYGNAEDLEEKNRRLVAEAVAHLARERSASGLPVEILELGCGNGKVLVKCLGAVSSNCRITGIDSSPTMVKVARERVASSPYISLIETDIQEWAKTAPTDAYDMVFAANTLHNLPSVDAIIEVIQHMVRLTKAGGLVVFDVRNSLNPLLRYGYWKNRRAGMQFFPFSPFQAARLLKRAGCTNITSTPLAYATIAQAGKAGKPAWFRFLYQAYLALTRRTACALYVHIEARKV